MARALIFLLPFVAGAALAQPVADPTRPPAYLDAAAGQAGMSTAPSLLQSILRPAGARPKALLGGEWIELGHKYNDARLVKITETSVTLRGPGGDETLYLTPDAIKQPVKPAPVRRSDSSTRGKM